MDIALGAVAGDDMGALAHENHNNEEIAELQDGEIQLFPQVGVQAQAQLQPLPQGGMDAQAQMQPPPQGGMDDEGQMQLPPQGGMNVQAEIQPLPQGGMNAQVQGQVQVHLVQISYINEFPDELIMKILVHLSPYVDAKNARLVSKRWLRLINVIEQQNKEMFENALKTHNIMWQIKKTRRYDIKDILLPGSRDRPYRTRVSRPTVETPSPRYSHSSVVHGHHMYVFGGANSDLQSGTSYNDLYTLDLSTYKWRKVKAEDSSLHPGPREAASFVAHQGQLVLHGGVCRPAYDRQHTLPPRFFDDTQVFDIRSQIWTRVQPVDETFPSARAAESASMVGHLMVTFGGVYRAHRYNDVWQFDLKRLAWKMCRIRGKKPPERFGHSQFTISENRVIVLAGSGSSNQELSDMWLLDTDIWSWTAIRVDNIPCEPVRSWCHPPVMVNGDVIAFSDGKICPYCSNFIEGYSVPRTAPGPDAEDCTCGRKWSERNPRPNAEPTDPIYLQMYVLDCSKVLSEFSCAWLEYHHLSPSPLSRRQYSACVGINEILIFGGVEESGPYKVKDCTIVVAAKPPDL